MTVAFLGLGRMGVLMAGHLARSGADLVVWNRTPGRAGTLVALGAREAGSVAAAVTGADRVVLMLFGPESVREVLTAALPHLAPGALVIDSSTVGPAAAQEFARRCADGGARYVDAPVAGSLGPAEAGTLGVFVGGSPEDVADALPLLELWGDPARIRRVGPVGSGSALKLVVNATLGVAMAGLGEVLGLARDLGLNRTDVLDVLAGGALGWTVGQKRPLLDARDYTDTSFSLDLMAKDLHLATAAADADLAVIDAALTQARRALAAGHCGEDFAALAGYLADER